MPGEERLIYGDLLYAYYPYPRFKLDDLIHQQKRMSVRQDLLYLDRIEDRHINLMNRDIIHVKSRQTSIHRLMATYIYKMTTLYFGAAVVAVVAGRALYQVIKSFVISAEGSKTRTGLG